MPLEAPESHGHSERSPLLASISERQQEYLRETPATLQHKLHHWQQLSAAMLSFAVLGLFTSSIGVMVPHLQKQFQLDEVRVSLAFIIPPVGYVFVAQFNNFIHLEFGQRGIAVLGPLCHILCTIIICVWPTFGVYIVALTVAAIGNALLDGSWCSWAASMKNANSMSGLLHASFATGAGIGPFLATKLLDANGSPWYYWYFVLMITAGIEGLVLTWSFWAEDAAAYRKKYDENAVDNDIGDISRFETWKRCLSNSSCWICAAYLLVYVGTETTVSDWTVTFMLRSRHASAGMSAASSSGFWVSMAVGRLVLGPVTDRVGVKGANFIYLCSAIILVILLPFVKIPAASVMIISGTGFFFGPMFASSIVRLTSTLPVSMRIVSVSFVTSVGQIGAAVLPYGLGALIKAVGIDVFSAALLVQLTTATLLWALL